MKQTIKLTFSEALDAVKKGALIQREGWNGRGLTVSLVQETEDTVRHLVINDPRHVQRVPWLASHTDVLASDWRIIE